MSFVCRSFLVMDIKNKVRLTILSAVLKKIKQIVYINYIFNGTDQDFYRCIYLIHVHYFIFVCFLFSLDIYNICYDLRR